MINLMDVLVKMMESNVLMVLVDLQNFPIVVVKMVILMILYNLMLQIANLAKIFVFYVQEQINVNNVFMVITYKIKNVLNVLKNFKNVIHNMMENNVNKEQEELWNYLVVAAKKDILMIL